MNETHCNFHTSLKKCCYYCETLSLTLRIFPQALLEAQSPNFTPLVRGWGFYAGVTTGKVNIGGKQPTLSTFEKLQKFYSNRGILISVLNVRWSHLIAVHIEATCFLNIWGQVSILKENQTFLNVDSWKTEKTASQTWHLMGKRLHGLSDQDYLSYDGWTALLRAIA